MEVSTVAAGPEKKEHHRTWVRVFFVGLLLYFVSIALVAFTGNVTLFPTAVLLGSFMVPATFVTFLYERRRMSDLSMPTVALSFFWGGILGVLSASILEPIFVQGLNLATAFVIGLIEEMVKLLGIFLVVRRRPHDAEMNGLLLGAAAGMGFAALESTGYAFTSFLRSGGSLSATVIVTLIRALLSPVGHGTWTAILAGVIFHESENGHYRFTRYVVGAYLLVVILHGLWDAVPIVISAFLLPGLDVFIGQATVGLTGALIFWWRWREAIQEQAQVQEEEIETV
jgi:RsiW-degrading membrane proteinase PrsW (M82 family)